MKGSILNWVAQPACHALLPARRLPPAPGLCAGGLTAFDLETPPRDPILEKPNWATDTDDGASPVKESSQPPDCPTVSPRENFQLCPVPPRPYERTATEDQTSVQSLQCDTEQNNRTREIGGNKQYRENSSN